LRGKLINLRSPARAGLLFALTTSPSVDQRITNLQLKVQMSAENAHAGRSLA
jgi:hypothetical protein